MSIWGKIIGGAAGFALGGPLGALLGAGIGHAVDSGAIVGGARKVEGSTRQVAFTIGVIALSAKMAKADGRVTRDEIDAFRQVFHVPPHEVKNVGRIWNMARQDTAGYEAYAHQIAKLFIHQRTVLEELLDALFYIAKADGQLHPAELEFVENVASIFGFSEAEYQAIAARHMDSASGNPYAILGVEPDVSDVELKKTYRKLVREHHPDRLIAQGLPEEFINVATERLAAINTAYDVLSKQRDLK